MGFVSSRRRSSALVYPQDKHHHQRSDSSVIDRDHLHSTSLTVWRKSLVCCCDGFTVIDSEGDLVYRVDNYRGRSGDVVLMDCNGRSIHTIRRHKKLSFVETWLVYEGEVSGQPAFTVKKQGNILNSASNVLAHVSLGGSTDKLPVYTIEGSYSKRSCKVLDRSGDVVVEIKNKEASNGSASFGSEVFQLVVQPRFDPSLAMAIVLLLDQMFA